LLGDGHLRVRPSRAVALAYRHIATSPLVSLLVSTPLYHPTARLSLLLSSPLLFCCCQLACWVPGLLLKDVACDPHHLWTHGIPWRGASDWWSLDQPSFTEVQKSLKLVNSCLIRRPPVGPPPPAFVSNPCSFSSAVWSAQRLCFRNPNQLRKPTSSTPCCLPYRLIRYYWLRGLHRVELPHTLVYYLLEIYNMPNTVTRLQSCQALPDIQGRLLPNTRTL